MMKKYFVRRGISKFWIGNDEFGNLDCTFCECM
jgi:hypothetical protein